MFEPIRSSEHNTCARARARGKTSLSLVGSETNGMLKFASHYRDRELSDLSRNVRIVTFEIVVKNCTGPADTIRDGLAGELGQINEPIDSRGEFT